MKSFLVLLLVLLGACSSVAYAVEPASTQVPTLDDMLLKMKAELNETRTSVATEKARTDANADKVKAGEDKIKALTDRLEQIEQLLADKKTPAPDPSAAPEVASAPPIQQPPASLAPPVASASAPFAQPVYQGNRNEVQSNAGVMQIRVEHQLSSSRKRCYREFPGALPPDAQGNNGWCG